MDKCKTSLLLLLVCLLVVSGWSQDARGDDLNGNSIVVGDDDGTVISGSKAGLRGGDDSSILKGFIAMSPDDGENHGFVDATLRSFAMIIVSELGDETFIIAAIMAMRHPRGVILGGALLALYVMTVLSAALGLVLPTLLSPDITRKIATFMYFFFGVRLLWIGYHAEEEVEEEIEEVEKQLRSSKKKTGIRAFFGRICTTVFVEAFVLTFLAEWGDRSQIATITLAAHSDPLGVIIGGCVGHSICTAIAVFGGRLIATQISQRTVAFAGSATFFVFFLLNVI